MGATFSGYGGGGAGNLTAAAGTRIQFLVPPSGTAQPGITRVTGLICSSGTTGHRVTAANPIGKTTMAAAAAAGTAAISLAADPGLHPSVVALSNNLAANDIIAIREVDGVTRKYIVNNIASPSILNLTTTLTAGAGSGAKVWDFGLPTDTQFANGAPHTNYAPPVNVATTFADAAVGLEPDAPMLLDSDNATEAGKVAVTWTYTRY